jgi:hypothetical protein
VYRLGEHTACQAFDIQIFDRNYTEVLDQPERKLVLKLMPLVLDSLVNFLQQHHRFSAALRTFLATSNFTLGTSQLRFGLLIPPGVWHRLVIRQGCEVCESDINSNLFRAGWQWFCFALYGKTRIPFTAFTFDGDCFNLATNRAVQFDFDLSDTLNAKHVVVQLDAVPVTRERDAIKTTARFESRISRFLTTLHTTKERLVGLVYTAKDILAAREVGQPKVTSGSNLFQLIRLRVVVNRDSLLPRITTLLQRSIVQATRFA